MADRVRKVDYCYVTVSNRSGEGEAVLGALKDAGVDMIAFSGFPGKKGKAQLDIVAGDLGPIRKLGRKLRWKLSKPKKGFVVDGVDRPGAVHEHLKKLGDSKISIVAADAICAGEGRYGMILWVKQKDYKRAARALEVPQPKKEPKAVKEVAP
jgi:hypothetical protein